MLLREQGRAAGSSIAQRLPELYQALHYWDLNLKKKKINLACCTHLHKDSSPETLPETIHSGTVFISVCVVSHFYLQFHRFRGKGGGALPCFFLVATGDIWLWWFSGHTDGSQLSGMMSKNWAKSSQTPASFFHFLTWESIHLPVNSVPSFPVLGQV